MRQPLVLAASFLFVIGTQAQGRWGSSNLGDGHTDGSSGCPPWLTGAPCDSPDDGNTSVDGSSNPSYLGLSVDEISKSGRLMTIHAILACVVWLIVIPTGGILMRLGVRSPWVLRAHAMLQTLGFATYVVAVGLGIWLVRRLSFGQFSLWKSSHTRYGIVILALATLQPVLGALHHRAYKRMSTNVDLGGKMNRPRTTIPGVVHLWLGRLLIISGVINGALGLKLAAESPLRSNTQVKAIGYGIGASVMIAIYLVFVVVSERQRSHKAPKSTMVEGCSQIAEDQLAPPSYEQSQHIMNKGAQTTARYI